MAEVKNETPSPAKRKPDLETLDQKNDPKKKKPEISENPTIDEEKLKKVEGDPEAEAEAEAEAESESETESEDEEGDVDDEVPSNGKSVIDNKGKGIMKESKGKGKLDVEEGSVDSDSSNEGNLSDVDSDLSDDSLAEVDRDNILPSRTRRRVAQPGSYLVNDLDDDDDSDDSDTQVMIPLTKINDIQTCGHERKSIGERPSWVPQNLKQQHNQLVDGDRVSLTGFFIFLSVLFNAGPSIMCEEF